MTIDHDALRVKYREERDKRLRPDGNDQYLEPTGRFAATARRSLRRADRARAAVRRGHRRAHRRRLLRACASGARLKQAGIDDVRIIEGGGDFGGTWYWNRYPGAMCDTAAMIYLPLLEETGHMPTAKYVHGARDLRALPAHRQARSTSTTTRCSPPRSPRSSGTQPRRAGSSAPTAATRSAPGSWRWAPVRCNRPKLPGIPGIETFAGHCFHTSRWDYAYTGGDWTGAPMTNLADKRVGIIGTGATAVQCIPPLARDAQRAVRVPAHAVVDRRAQQPPDRSRVVRDARARLAAASGC